jgi:hypothetical protein
MGCEDLISKRAVKNWVSKLILFVSMFLATLSLSWAGSTTGADFLKIPTSARSVSLGNAYTALASGVDSIDRNTAGLGRGPAALAFSHQQIFGENNLDYLAASWPGAGMNSWAWGLSVNRLGYAVQERRGADRSVSGSFGSSDLSVGLSVAKSIGFLNVGTQIKMIHQDLAGYTANGMAVDLGLQSPTPFSRLSMGLAVRNIGPQMKFVTEEYHLPLMISGGVAYKMIQPLTLVFDIQHSPYQQQTSAALGLEFAPAEFAPAKLTSKGFFDEITVQDFPIRDMKSYLHIKRRRWINESTGDIVYRNWNMVAKGTRMTHEFASFLKEIARYKASKR